MGRINCRLKVRQGDEALFYQAEKDNLDLQDCEDILCLQSKFPKNLDISLEEIWNEISEECYLVSRYRDILLKWDKFNFLVENILEKAEICDRKQEAVVLMEQMMLYQGDYYWIEEAGCSVLLYKSEGICHNILNVFAEQMGAALEREGQEVEYFDTEQEGISALSRFAGKHFRAIIGMQSYLFGVKLKDGTFLHDLIKGPKYNFVFDHPIWMKHHLTDVPKNFYVITHDTNYVRFVDKYFHLPSYLLPPAGEQVFLENLPKTYDISFVGAYGDYWSEILSMHALPREVRFIANHFLLELRRTPHFTAEEALTEVYRKRGQNITEEELLSSLWAVRRVYYCAMHYFRHHIIKTLLEAGLQIDVFGDTWFHSPLRRYSNLVYHPDASFEESIRIWQQSKLSLNVMSWHKGGFTERMANIMLCKTALVTDETEYLKGRYTPDEDMIVFRLDELEKLPGKLKQYLEDKEKRDRVAENGWRKACQNETWDSRAKEFLRLCEGV